MNEFGQGPTSDEMAFNADDQAQREQLEQAGFTREPGEKPGEFIERDAAGNETMRAVRDHQGDLQVIRHGQAAQGRIENAKFTDGNQAGKELRREYPGIPAAVEVAGLGSVNATLLELGSMKNEAGEFTPTNGRLEVTDSASLALFEQVPVAERQPEQDPTQGTYAVIGGDRIGSISAEVNGRMVELSIGRASVTFSPDGSVKGAWFHKVNWAEKQA